mmetsp:Transcript_13497/g.47596  ORF Transcript_13497/g.47596 Transcript_13497/m.47596 type:complete len:395 (+) Transcript_13497:2-1186(+)
MALSSCMRSASCLAAIDSTSIGVAADIEPRSCPVLNGASQAAAGASTAPGSKSRGSKGCVGAVVIGRLDAETSSSGTAIPLSAEEQCWSKMFQMMLQGASSEHGDTPHVLTVNPGVSDREPSGKTCWFAIARISSVQLHTKDGDTAAMALSSCMPSACCLAATGSTSIGVADIEPRSCPLLCGASQAAAGASTAPGSESCGSNGCIGALVVGRLDAKTSSSGTTRALSAEGQRWSKMFQMILEGVSSEHGDTSHVLAVSPGVWDREPSGKTCGFAITRISSVQLDTIDGDTTAMALSSSSCMPSACCLAASESPSIGGADNEPRSCPLLSWAAQAADRASTAPDSKSRGSNGCVGALVMSGLDADTPSSHTAIPLSAERQRWSKMFQTMLEGAS